MEQSSRNDVLVLVEDKFERRLSDESSRLDNRLTTDSAKLDRSIAQAETRILRWLVVLWTSQIAAAHFWK